MSLNRRQFLWASSAGVAALAMPNAGLGASVPRAKFKLGLGTYTFRLLDINGLIGHCKELNLRTIELSHPQYMLPQATLEEFRSVREPLTSGGVNLMSWFSANPSTRSSTHPLLQAC